MQPEVYITVNGERFRHDALREDREANRFMALSGLAW